MPFVNNKRSSDQRSFGHHVQRDQRPQESGHFAGECTRGRDVFLVAAPDTQLDLAVRPLRDLLLRGAALCDARRGDSQQRAVLKLEEGRAEMHLVRQFAVAREKHRGSLGLVDIQGVR